MKKILTFIKKETVLTVAWALAALSAFWVRPGAFYFDYIDFRSLGILWSLMAIMQGLKCNGVFEAIGWKLLEKTRKVGELVAVLVFLCFFTAMFITNDVALITFVPFTVMMLINCRKEELMIPVIVLQTIAANLGSMLTPIGNPQNLYLYGLSGLSIREFLLYMLPFSAVSAVLLLAALALIRGKEQKIRAGEHSKGVRKYDKKRTLRITVYLALFIFSLLVVVHVVPCCFLVISVLILLFVLEKRVLLDIDYALLFTFIGFFIFTGNMGNVDIIKEFLQHLVAGREVFVGILTSQCISNVPAALLLSGFTTDYKSLLLGVNLGGLGTLIASMASLISYKFLVNQYPDKKGRYMLWFTIANIIFLLILSGFYFLIYK